MSTLTELRADDAEVFWDWLREQLSWHLEHWSNACQLGWDEGDIAARIADGRLIEREWAELVTASEQPEALVRVLRDDAGGVLGAVYCRSRPDPWLGLSVGVLCWLHVNPDARGRGLARPLVEAAMDWFAAQDLSLAEVHVTAANQVAVRAYARGGFEIIDHRMLVGIRER